ncbi:MAG TPA: transposase [Bacteroidetes bacterium]|nr:transposase [Bacteroidota bacterium]
MKMEEELVNTFTRYRSNFKTKTRDSSAHGWTVLKGYLLLETNRTYQNIDRKINGVNADGQNIQQFMSDSPWSWEGVFNQVMVDIKSNPALSGGTLNFDESGDQCSGPHKAGASRQYIGRAGKVELGQVGVLSSYSIDNLWLLTGAELFLPRKWFNQPQLRKKWKRLKIPLEREFATKVEIAISLFDKAIDQNLPFKWVGGDALYGRSLSFRRHIADNGKYYMMCIPKDEHVWLSNPLTDEDKPVGKKVSELVEQADFEPIMIRNAERGQLIYEQAFVPVWTVGKNKKAAKREARKELLVIRKEPDGSTSYALTNASLAEVGKEEIAVQRAERYFVERTIQDCKSELGWDELQALKYPAYMHSLAICAVALIFLLNVKLKQREKFDDPETVQEELGIERLPDISLANVKELMRSVMPLPRLTRKEARKKIVQILFDRSKSTASRRRKQRKNQKEKNDTS